jgi:phosphatidylethanolamine/phosphatidyl-N-methylethanolamine N-methyltransferase
MLVSISTVRCCVAPCRALANSIFNAVQGDAQRLPFADNSFDSAVLHLILAVVPQPAHCFAEIARVLKPGGEVLVFDKFLRRGQTALLRRLANPLMRRIATRLDVVFEDLLSEAPRSECWHMIKQRLAGGWFSMIRLRR